MATTTTTTASEPSEPSSIPRTTEPPSSPPNTTPLPPSLSPTAHRLGLPFDRRLLLSASTALLTGFTLGSTTAGRLASLRYRAENAHRLPTTNPGWFLYHKSKNYYKARWGITAGLRQGIYLASWSTLFFVLEESIDVFRGTWRAGRTLGEMEGVDELEMGRVERGVSGCRDFGSSGLAGMVTGGVWSAWNGFAVNTAARTIRMGLVVGVGYGLGQDVLMWARGRRNGGWVDRTETWILGFRRGDGDEEKVAEKV